MHDINTTKPKDWQKYEKSRDEVRMARVWSVICYLITHGQLPIRLNWDEILRKAEEYDKTLPSG